MCVHPHAAEGCHAKAAKGRYFGNYWYVSRAMTAVSGCDWPTCKLCRPHVYAYPHAPPGLHDGVNGVLLLLALLARLQAGGPRHLRQAHRQQQPQPQQPGSAPQPDSTRASHSNGADLREEQHSHSGPWGANALYPFTSTVGLQHGVRGQRTRPASRLVGSCHSRAPRASHTPPFQPGTSPTCPSATSSRMWYWLPLRSTRRHACRMAGAKLVGPAMRTYGHSSLQGAGERAGRAGR